jgi:hypothetical protein
VFRGGLSTGARSGRVEMWRGDGRFVVRLSTNLSASSGHVLWAVCSWINLIKRFTLFFDGHVPQVCINDLRMPRVE